MSNALFFRFGAISFILGLFLAPFCFWFKPLYFPAILLFSFLMICGFFLKKPRVILVGLVGLSFFIGFWRFSQYQLKPRPLFYLVKNQPINKMSFQLKGLIINDPKETEKSKTLLVKLKEGKSEKYLVKTSEKIAVMTDTLNDFHYGQEILIQGDLTLPIKDVNFDWQSYWQKEDVYLMMFYPQIQAIGENKGSPIISFLFSLKNHFNDYLTKSIKEPSVYFISGLIFGGTAGFNEKTKDDFRRVGLSHIVAVSGYNLTIVSDFLRNISLSLGLAAPLSFWFSFLGILAFVILTGASAAVVRAGIMATLVLIARRTGRLYHSLNAILLAALLMLFQNPNLLAFDLGFQLSFLATLGLIYLSPFYSRLLKTEKKSFLSWRANFSSTLSALTMVMPYLLYKQASVSFIAPLANFLVVPLIPFLMFLGFLSALFNFLFWPLGLVLGFNTQIFGYLILSLIHFLAHLPISYLNFYFPKLFLLMSALFIYFFLIRMINKESKRLKFQND